MQSRAGKKMLAVLAPLRVYRLEEDSRVYAELSAYDAAFCVLENLLEQAREGAFVQTAGGAALRRYEALVGLPERADMNEQKRRELVIYRLSVAPFDFTPEKMLGSMRAAGIEAELTESPESERLVVKSIALLDPTLTIDIAKARLEALVPAHLEWDLDFGFTSWGELELMDYTWNELDALDCEWENLDAYIQNLITQGGL